MTEKSTRVENFRKRAETITGFNGYPLIPINVDNIPGSGYIPETNEEDDNGRSTTTSPDNRGETGSNRQSGQ
jgi:hypothetical protein